MARSRIFLGGARLCGEGESERENESFSFASRERGSGYMLFIMLMTHMELIEPLESEAYKFKQEGNCKIPPPSPL